MSNPVRGLMMLVGLMMASGAAWAATAMPVAPAGAATAVSVASNSVPNANEVIRQAETYFAGLNTAKARFVQTSPDGTQRVGTFYLSRPGKLRFEYDPPSKDIVVADGVQLFFYDGELKQTSSAPVGQTLADFLLRKNIKLSGDVRVMGVTDGGGLLQIMLTQSADPNAGTMTLGFTPSPFALKKWRVVDGQGQTTEVELFDSQQNMVLPGSLFVYRDPLNPKGKFNE